MALFRQRRLSLPGGTSANHNNVIFVFEGYHDKNYSIRILIFKREFTQKPGEFPLFWL